MKRLWVVSELYFPEDTSTGYFVTHIAEGLAHRFDVHAVCAHPTYSERHLETAGFERCNGVDIHRLPATRFDKDSMPGRIVNLLTFTFSCLFFLAVSVKRGDRLLVLTNPPSIPLFAGLIAKMKGAEPHLLVHDVYPELLSAAAGMSERSMIYRTLMSVMRFTLAKYEKIAVLGRDMAEITMAKLSKNKDRVTVIPNWGDTDGIYPQDRLANPFGRERGLGERTLIQMSGNLGKTHDVELVLAAARELRERKDIVFQFIGYGGKASVIRESLQAGDLDNVMFLPRQPRERLGEVLSRSDASVIPFVPKMHGISVPSRMYDVMAAGTPIIAVAGESSELAMVVTEEECGWVVPPGALDDLVRIVETVAAQPEEAVRRGLAGREAALRRYTRDKVVEQFAEMLG